MLALITDPSLPLMPTLAVPHCLPATSTAAQVPPRLRRPCRRQKRTFAPKVAMYKYTVQMII
jgi:hypothetical protein